jgi:hypothetical protein
MSLVGAVGIEPTTPCSGGTYSIHLGYGRVENLVHILVHEMRVTTHNVSQLSTNSPIVRH